VNHSYDAAPTKAPEPGNFGGVRAQHFSFNRHILWSKPIVQVIQWFLVFNGPNHSGTGAKNLHTLEPELKILDAWRWSPIF